MKDNQRAHRLPRINGRRGTFQILFGAVYACLTAATFLATSFPRRWCGSVSSLRRRTIRGRAAVKVKELDVEGQAYQRAQGINAEIVEALRDQIKDLNGRLDSMEKEVKEVRDHNNALITFAYRLISLARKYGYEEEIPSPAPHGIHV
jgi:hypothetical protein